MGGSTFLLLQSATTTRGQSPCSVEGSCLVALAGDLVGQLVLRVSFLFLTNLAAQSSSSFCSRTCHISYWSSDQVTPIGFRIDSSNSNNNNKMQQHRTHRYRIPRSADRNTFIDKFILRSADRNITQSIKQTTHMKMQQTYLMWEP